MPKNLNHGYYQMNVEHINKLVITYKNTVAKDSVFYYHKLFCKI